MIKYLGSKRLLVGEIAEQIQGPGIDSVLDVFSGTSRVSYELKRQGFNVVANDLMTFAKVIADCYIAGDANVDQKDVERLVKEYNEFSGRKHGYFTETFCIKSRYFKPKNGERIDFIREDIERKGLSPILKSIMLTSLMEAADRVDSTVGLQMAYLKSWAPRADNDLELRVPNLLPGRGRTAQMDAKDFAAQFKADAAYLDPPYNQHSYLGNYHIWETLCKWDEPEHYGVACKRQDVRERKSNFNYKKKAFDALEEVVKALQVKKIVVSFSDEGFIERPDMEDMLSKYGQVKVTTKDFNRYVGAKIGIHNPSGRKVGRVSHLKNKEFIYVVER